MNDFANSIGIEPEDEVVINVFDGSGEFEGEVFLSTDGKHTVRYKANTEEGRKNGGKWAVSVYKGIVNAFGTKAQMWEKTMTNGKTEKKAEETFRCAKCGGPAVYREGKTEKGKEWRGVFCNDKEGCGEVRWISK